MKPDESRLIEAAQAGCTRSFTTLASRYQDRLLAFLLSRGFRHADAEDAVQEALLAAWRYLPSYNARWRFSTWLFRIGLRKLPQPQATEVLLHDTHAAPTPTPMRDVDVDNVWRAAVRLLSDEAYSALWLRYAEDLSVREIAGALQRSVPWVKVSLMRSRRKLAATLGQEISQ